jgi:predicted NBD/HSP70 family sugar kinase
MEHFVLGHKRPASNKTPRQINRNLLFNLVRREQAISRVDLARVSGLQGSTVSLIVEELIAERWLIEGSTTKTPRGRRPTFLQLNGSRAVVALDIHPAQTTVAVAELGGRIVEQRLVEIPANPRLAISAIIVAIRSIIKQNPDKTFDGIGMSLPGRADPRLEKLIFAPNLHWPVLGIKSRIQKATGLPVEIENVANACALSEVWFGDSDAMNDLVVVNVSEGIGTGIFANGRLLRGKDGMAGEFGHIEIEPGGPLCACGNRGCWEVTASNRAGLRYFHEAAPERKGASFDAMLRLARSGDLVAIAALEKMSGYLGRGLRMIVAALAPSEIILVGDITMVWDLVGPIIEKEVKRNAISKSPSIRPARDGNAARLRSAVALVLNRNTVWTPQ